MFVPVFMKPLFSAQLENLQKRIYQLEEQLHSEMQLKDELEQKCRYGTQMFCSSINSSKYHSLAAGRCLIQSL